MSCESLIKMANQIAQYFASEPDHTLAVNGVRQHIKSFWTPGMRRELAEWQEKHPDAALHPLVVEALTAFREPA
ncbi:MULTISPECIES: formate dehydrogenase subunit delta [Pseudomonas]|jgi:formate dehydrogenase subunit delta|uniref:formate dehydrogenase subunit delta n=1 Tax=Pseudomonas TaxID=286 RepID=UPI000875FEB5|nr:MULTISPECIES: formate dehydrogenase subunit delta [Pseudomonas]MDB6444394.1 formate dehydrogenase subunit delta [Pseudomonas sp. 21TX0197]MDT8905176.1 formate dehydrogenase subunit delta [Pseudomonas prosekii]NHN67911.1 formate dehydrogenase subunit delta [Pseudomonas fluorescens]ROO36169.1 formate dehydrogenase [Pseudomonas sp. AF76]ROO36812.1 formate dehydrogenase [Pseudomonas sp. 7SR1]